MSMHYYVNSDLGEHLYTESLDLAKKKADEISSAHPGLCVRVYSMDISIPSLKTEEVFCFYKLTEALEDEE